MGHSNVYELCCKHQGRVATLHLRGGKTHRGKIVDVTPTHVYLQPIGGRNLGGLGYGFYGGFGFGYRPFAVPLALVTGFALGSLFWW